ncbi:MAG: DNA polymerase I [Bacteroidales bacterium]|nr:DNA polymerase I [Bacteroidales bacterium]
MKKLFIIDGHALIFKMYYAFLRRPMINSKGVDTSILYGFTKYLLEIISKEQPSHIAVAFDPPAKTFRHELYPEYKANRMVAPELVKEAYEPLCEIVGSLGIPVLAVPGYEADDTIGTIAKRFEKEGFDVFMVTPDKDFGQLISDHVFQYKPGKSGEGSEVVGVAEVCAQYEIQNPLQVIDILTLWGDASDNVPGVRGVGEKGARKLVSEFGSVENIYANLDRLSEKQREAFREAEDHIGLSKTLVTIKTDVPLEITENDLLNEVRANSETLELFDRYEFNSLKRMLPQGEVKVIVETPQNSLKIKSIAGAEIRRSALENHLCSVRTDDCICISCGDNQYATFSFDDSLAREILENETVDKITYGAKEDFKRLRDRGIVLKGKIYDIELMHYVLNPERSHKIDLLARGYMNISFENTENEADREQSAPADLFSAPAISATQNDDRSAKECVAAYLLYPYLLKELGEQQSLELYNDIEMPLIRVLAQMEMTGVKIDTKALADYGKSLGEQMDALESEIREMAGEPALNISSPRQIGIVLFEKLQLDPKAKKNKNDNYTTDEETLLALKDRHPIVGKILEFRAVKKLLSTYIEPLPALINPASGKIHTTYTQALTATGRLSSIKPNLQNIPVRTDLGREIRKAFIPSTPDGYIVSADYSQIELRIMAHLSGDKSMIADFSHGDDIHAATAAKIFKVPVGEVTKDQRRQAKTANFGIIYGISAFGLSQRLGISNRESKELITQYFESYPAVAEYIQKVADEAREKGYVKTIFGRRRFLPDINSRNQVVRKLAERNAVNAPIQGSAADIIKLAMIHIADRLEKERFESKMVMQVHDELIFDAIPSETEKLMRMVKEEMENVYKMSVALVVDCNKGENWLEAH